ncbi:hypothetical protein SAY87_014288 [Trapa incisa]|uniref:Histone-lysine N-methyltransferase, H3 lysine-9 specific SUVH4 n=1 Tax=Trapa incisa TaxID=236973 RepID=A0AAN7H2N9_9MYRT|nr:hypothetical protein SAY87_014288 [Trapa incisa]
MVEATRQSVNSTPKGTAGGGVDQCNLAAPLDSDAVKSPGNKIKEKDELEESDAARRPDQRRRSSRIQTLQRAEKELLAKRKMEASDAQEEGPVKKRVNVGRRVAVNAAEDVTEAAPKEKQTLTESAAGEGDNAASGKSDYVKIKETLCERVLGRSLEVGNGSTSVVAGIPHVAEKSDHAKVKETLRLFNTHYLHFVQGEEERCRKEDSEEKTVTNVSTKNASKKSNQENAPKEDKKKISKRPDLKAVSKMLETNTTLNPKKRIGDIPGVMVGHQFYSRAEMVVIGFHSHWLNGIDYMGLAYQQDYRDYKFPLAVAIVLSGMYEDDLDNADEIVYTGQGGHNLTGDKRQIKDQTLERGNLALKNCIDQDVPVRVIRGHECANSYTGKIYTYDGLYKVVKFWADKGISGFTVYKYRLRRIQGQPMLTTNQVQFINGRVPQSVSHLRGCKGNCIDPRTCACAKLNGSDFPYVERDGGRLIEAKDVIYECGPKCGCGPECINRVSQRGLRHHLEVIAFLHRSDVSIENFRFFEFHEKGGLLDHGTLYLLEHPFRRSRGSSSQATHQLDSHDDQRFDAPEFCIDAGSSGNIARFINHSCEPNLFVQCVLSSHHDMKLARVVLFAADNIPPLQELTYDYGYVLDSVLGSDGKTKRMPCYCGAVDCRKRLF